MTIQKEKTLHSTFNNPNNGHKATRLTTHGEQGTKERSESRILFLSSNSFPPDASVSPMISSKCISSWFSRCIISCDGNTRNITEGLDCWSSHLGPVHIALSCVLLLTMNSADGSLLELPAPCLDPLDLLDSS